jgi:hypothetical protein
MPIIKTTLILLCILLLGGCVRPIEAVEHRSMCKIACLKKLNSCFYNCQDSCLTCGRCLRRETALPYKRYVREQIVQGDLLLAS